MPSIAVAGNHYRIDGKPGFLISGEMHYFRAPRADWATRMDRLIEAGGTCLAEYFEILADLLETSGCQPPFLHNACSPEQVPYFLEANHRLTGRLLIGSDHYYNLDLTWEQNHPTPQYAIRCLAALEMLRLMGHPPTVLEMPSGSLADYPPITGIDLDACYRLHAALGMKGMNWYVFTGGPNPPGLGTTGVIYDFGAPISATGEVRASFEVLKRFGTFLRRHAWLAQAETDACMRYGLDWLTVRMRTHEHGQDHYSAWSATKHGLLTSAACAHLSTSFVDLAADAWIYDHDRPLMVAGTTAMTRIVQERLIAFLTAGGKVLLTGAVPVEDEHQRSCPLLAHALGLTPDLIPERETDEAPFDLLGISTIPANQRMYSAPAAPAGATVLACRNGRVLAWEVAVGAGRCVFLGLRWKHSQHEHHRMLRALFRHLGGIPNLTCDRPEVWLTLRTAGSRSLCFAMNLWTSPTTCRIQARPAWAADLIDLGEHHLKPMEVKAIPVGARKAD